MSRFVMRLHPEGVALLNDMSERHDQVKRLARIAEHFHLVLAQFARSSRCEETRLRAHEAIEEALAIAREGRE